MDKKKHNSSLVRLIICATILKYLLNLASFFILEQEMCSQDIMTTSMDILSKLKSMKKGIQLMEEEINELWKERKVRCKAADVHKSLLFVI